MILRLRGVFTFEVLSSSGKLLHSERIRNGIATAGITDMFLQYFVAGTGITPYIGLIDEVSFDAVAATDTMASHAGWVEITDYDEATRPAWGPDTPSSGQITNSVKAVFTMNAAKTAKGLFISSNNTKGGTAGVLWNTAVSSLSRELQSGQAVRAGYTLLGAGA
jgi:hypothetical protein